MPSRGSCSGPGASGPSAPVFAPRERSPLSAPAQSSPPGLELAHGNTLAKKGYDVRPVFRSVGLLVGSKLIREFSGRRFQFADHMSEPMRIAGMNHDPEVDADRASSCRSRIDLDVDPRGAHGVRVLFRCSALRPNQLLRRRFHGASFRSASPALHPIRGIAALWLSVDFGRVTAAAGSLRSRPIPRDTARRSARSPY